MHIYYKYKVYLKNYENNLNRTIICRAITPLGNLAACLMATFRTSGKKKFYFEINDEIYECSEALRYNYLTNNHHNVDLALSRIDPKKFVFVYDYDDTYEFMIEKIEEGNDEKWRKAPEIESGVGYGILENNRKLLVKFFREGLSFDEFKELSKNNKIMRLDNFEYNEPEIKYYNEYNKFRKKRIEKD